MSATFQRAALRVATRELCDSIADLIDGTEFEPAYLVELLAERLQVKTKETPKPQRLTLVQAGAVALRFGKHAGASLSDVDSADPSYLDWMYEQNDELNAAIRTLREGRAPSDDGGSP